MAQLHPNTHFRTKCWLACDLIMKEGDYDWLWQWPCNRPTSDMRNRSGSSSRYQNIVGFSNIPLLPLAINQLLPNCRLGERFGGSLYVQRVQHLRHNNVSQNCSYLQSWDVRFVEESSRVKVSCTQWRGKGKEIELWEATGTIQIELEKSQPLNEERSSERSMADWQNSDLWEWHCDDSLK